MEDEPAAARQLKKMLEKTPGLIIDSLTICSSAAEAKKRLGEGLDLLFLDLNLRGESGFDVLEKFMAESFPVIITTAYPEHALRAFEVGASDYLVKPFSQDRLDKAVGRATSQRAEEATGNEAALAKLLVKDRDAIIPVDVDSVVLVRSAGDYCEIFIDGGRRHLLSKRMDYMEARLPDDFMRVHRTAIVRLSKVSSVTAGGGGRHEAAIEGVEGAVPVGRKYYRKLKQALGEG